MPDLDIAVKNRQQYSKGGNYQDVLEVALDHNLKGVAMPGYTLVYWQDGKWFVGRLRERPDVFSQGESLQDLEENIKEALALMEATDFEDLPPDYRVKELMVETG